MLQTTKIKLRDIEELQETSITLNQNHLLKTPVRKRKNTSAATTTKKRHISECDNESNISTNTLRKTTKRNVRSSAIKELPKSQTRIDSFFTPSLKKYLNKEETLTPIAKSKTLASFSTLKTVRSTNSFVCKPKRLFGDSISTSELGTSNVSLQPHQIYVISSDSDNEVNSIPEKSTSAETKQCSSVTNDIGKDSLSSKSNTRRTRKRIPSSSSTSTVSRRAKTKKCPPYKLIEGTTFAVDAFHFGYIENVTHYFLTHFHADHYLGLTKSFAMPIYMSSITARFLRAFIPVDEIYINELELNETYVFDGIEVTALDANHCPGAILLVFKFVDTGKCILHTGDFRACPNMESEPIFWNNDIHTIYLDTTYISDKYAFCTQYESLVKAHDLIDKFQMKHKGKRILYICGAYVIGKEKFWCALAEDYELKVWAEGNRYTALKAMDNEQLNKVLVEDPYEANMHIIAMGKLSYLHLVEYFKKFEQQYDVVFAIRPSGWEKNTKPQYRGKINIVGIEYSEHSSYAELKRFVKFLKPEKVISTVPTGRDPMKTATVPQNWYKFNQLQSSSNYQPSIDIYLGKTPQNKIRPPSLSKGIVENVVSPLKLKPVAEKQQEINNDTDKVQVSSVHSKAELEKCSTNSEQTKHFPSSSEDYEGLDVTIAREASKKIHFESNSADYFEAPNNSLNTCNKLKVVDNKNYNKKRHGAKCDGIALKLRNSDEMFEDLDTSVNTKTTKTSSKNGVKPLNMKSRKLNGENLLANCKRKLAKKPKLLFPLAEESEYFETALKPPITSACNNNTITVAVQRKSLTFERDLELPISQRRTIGCKRASLSSSSSKSTFEKEFETRLLNMTEKNEKNCIIKQQLDVVKSLKEFDENPIFKSTTTSVTSSEQVPSSRNKKKKNTSSTCRKDNPDESENLLKPAESKSKQNNLKSIQKQKNAEFNVKNHTKDPTESKESKRNDTISASSPTENIIENNLENFTKKSKLSIGSKRHALTPISGKRSHLKRSNDMCQSIQLIGQVMDNVNGQKSDESKDHLPGNLFLDADDDWI